MADLHFSRADATPEAWATVERVASEWLGEEPWDMEIPGGHPVTVHGWLDRENADAIPLHLPAGRDLAERVLAESSGSMDLVGFRERLVEDGFSRGGETYPETLRRLLLTSCGP